jgi:hypothetical protein
MALLEVKRLWADSARAGVVQLYGDYQAGDPVVAVAPYALDPRLAPEPTDLAITGRVVAFAVEQVLLGPGESVFLDVGGDEGVALGDEFAVLSSHEGDAVEPDATDALAILRVTRVTDATSTARVTSVRDPGTRPGDPVLLVRRLPAVPADPGG